MVPRRESLLTSSTSGCASEKRASSFFTRLALKFHETEDYTIYPAPIITVTKNRFTKHYFIGDKRVASKLGTGKFSNVYGISSNNVTAGQKDYAARMMQIEKQREEYYKSLGTPPGVPTMKGATADPDNTGYGYNTIIGELGDHSVPEGWVQRPKFNKKGDVPGPPIQWQKPEDPDNAQPGYGYVPTDTTNVEDIFFYHSDHLGSTSYVTDAKANITQFDAYLPYGELLVDEHSSSEEMPYKFNGKEFDQETGLYYYGARYMNPRTSLWYGVDPMAEKYPNVGGYIYCVGNPVKLIDPNGEDIEVVQNKDKTYTVTGGTLNKDNNIYIMQDGKRTGGILGKNLTPYSFFSSDNKAVVGAIINPTDLSGQNFFDKEIVNGKINIFQYMKNARGGQKYDFKTRGINEYRGKFTAAQYMYRGMPFRDGHGHTLFASARDIGNYSAGYMAGVSGQTWGASRKAFDALESWQNKAFSTEAMVSQSAERAGFIRGNRQYWQQQYEVQRILQEGREYTWSRIKNWFKSLFNR